MSSVNPHVCRFGKTFEAINCEKGAWTAAEYAKAVGMIADGDLPFLLLRSATSLVTNSDK